jgi:hypothetical protein
MYYDYRNDYLLNPHPLSDPGWSDGSLCRNGQFIPPVKQQFQPPGTTDGVLNYDDTPPISVLQGEAHVAFTAVNKDIISCDDTPRTSGLQTDVHDSLAVLQRLRKKINYADLEQLFV